MKKRDKALDTVDGKVLDPVVEKLVRAFARRHARQDHNNFVHGREPDPADELVPTAKSRLQTVVRLSDGLGGYKLCDPDRKSLQSFVERARNAIEDVKAGCDDDLGISKLLKPRSRSTPDHPPKTEKG